jgi:hypothetical protein
MTPGLEARREHARTTCQVKCVNDRTFTSGIDRCSRGGGSASNLHRVEKRPIALAEQKLDRGSALDA